MHCGVHICLSAREGLGRRVKEWVRGGRRAKVPKYLYCYVSAVELSVQMLWYIVSAHFFMYVCMYVCS